MMCIVNFLILSLGSTDANAMFSKRFYKKKSIYVMDLKVDGSAEEALRQIRDRDYAGKYIDYSMPDNPCQILYLTNNSSATRRFDCRDMQFPFFGNFILDILNGTENAMTQEHAFKAAELSLKAQIIAEETSNARK